MPDKRVRHEGFTCIGRIGGDYYFADSIFDHGDGFKGVTGSIVRPVSKDEWDDASDPENVAERLEDYYRECKGLTHWDDELDTDEFMVWVDRAIATDGISCLMFDGSDGEAASEAFNEMGIENVYTDCTGCGRIFGSLDAHNFDELFSLPAFAAIKDYEEGAGDADSTALAVFGG